MEDEQQQTKDEPKTVPSSNKIADEAVEAAGEVVEKAPEPKPLPKEPKKGVYILEAGDTPGIVARKIYGRGSYAIALARANMSSNWLEGDTIDLV